MGRSSRARRTGIFAVTLFCYGDGDARLCVGRRDGPEIETIVDRCVPWALFRDVVDQRVRLLAVAASDEKLAPVAQVLIETSVDRRLAEAKR